MDKFLKRGASFLKTGQYDLAIRYLQKAVKLDPDHPQAQAQLGLALTYQERFKEALRHYDAALTLLPESPDLLHNRGSVLLNLGRHRAAIEDFRRALALTPDAPNTLANLGAALSRYPESLEEALSCCRRALDLNVTLEATPDLLLNLGHVLQLEGSYQEAIDCCRRAIALNPDHHTAHTNLGLLLLLTGHYREGWQEHEWRWKSRELAPYHLEEGLWRGEDLNGKTLLLRPEQGYGDNLQFIRYAPVIKERWPDAALMLLCPPPLAPLLEGMPSLDRIVVQGRDEMPPYHKQISLFSLPYVMGTTLETIPSPKKPYLQAPPERIEQHRPLFADHPGLKMGLVWRGNPAQPNDLNRSIHDVSVLEPLLNLPGVSFFSLMKEVPESDRFIFEGLSNLVDLGPHLRDFADSAALITHLDLVITTCTSMAHLAGGLGARTWVLLGYSADWRWLLGRGKSPWYGSVRLFRQGLGRDWGEVISQVADATQKTK